MARQALLFALAFPLLPSGVRRFGELFLASDSGLSTEKPCPWGRGEGSQVGAGRPWDDELKWDLVAECDGNQILGAGQCWLGGCLARRV